jgi:hypothetical protein
MALHVLWVMVLSILCKADVFRFYLIIIFSNLIFVSPLPANRHQAGVAP